jgi:hypothetical protein
MTDTQNQQVLRYLKTGLELSPALAWRDLGIARLAARVFDLRRQGHPIERRMVKRADARFAVYRLPCDAQPE